MNILNVNKLNVRLYNVQRWRSFIENLGRASVSYIDVINRLIEAYKKILAIIVNPLSIISIQKLEALNSEIRLLEQRI